MSYTTIAHPVCVYVCDKQANGNDGSNIEYEKNIAIITTIERVQKDMRIHSTCVYYSFQRQWNFTRLCVAMRKPSLVQMKMKIRETFLRFALHTEIFVFYSTLLILTNQNGRTISYVHDTHTEYNSIKTRATVISTMGFNLCASTCIGSCTFGDCKRRTESTRIMYCHWNRLFFCFSDPVKNADQLYVIGHWPVSSEDFQNFFNRCANHMVILDNRSVLLTPNDSY